MWFRSAKLHRLASYVVIALGVATGRVDTAVAGEPSDLRRAASLYDDAVQSFERGEYEKAARLFLSADDAAPAKDTLFNAIAAAKRGHEHLLVVEAADRLLSRDSVAASEQVSARKSRAEAASHLALLDLSCAPEPCSITLEGEVVEPGARLVLPGTKTASATGPAEAVASETLKLEAGTSYRVVLHPTKPEVIASPSEVVREQPPATTKRPAATPPAVDQPEGEPSLSPTWVYVGTGVTTVLVAGTTWSGLDTLRAKNDLTDRPTQEDIDDVRGRVHRTDLLLASSALVGALTAYAAVGWVRWGDTPVQAALVPLPKGGWLGAGARF